MLLIGNLGKAAGQQQRGNNSSGATTAAGQQQRGNNHGPTTQIIPALNMTFIHDRRAAGKRLHYAWFHHIEYYNQHGLFITRSVCLICFVQVLATAALLQLLTGGRPSRPASWLWRAAAPPLTIAILYDWCGCVPTHSLTNRDKTTEISERERERKNMHQTEATLFLSDLYDSSMRLNVSFVFSIRLLSFSFLLLVLSNYYNVNGMVKEKKCGIGDEMQR